jgi:hypothetical protein
VPTAQPTEQKFFGSFFQKRTAYLLAILLEIYGLLCLNLSTRREAGLLLVKRTFLYQLPWKLTVAKSPVPIE